EVFPARNFLLVVLDAPELVGLAVGARDLGFGERRVDYDRLVARDGGDFGDVDLDRARAVHGDEGEADEERAGAGADEDADLLLLRRRADEEAGLEILAGGAGVGGDDADNGAHADGDNALGDAGLPADEEEEAGAEERGHG